MPNGRRERTGPSDREMMQRIEKNTEGKLARLNCGEYKRRLLDMNDLAREVPKKGRVLMSFREEWRRGVGRLLFFAVRQDCFSHEERRQLSRHSRQVAGELGQREVFDVADEFGREIRNAFSGSTAGMGPG